MKLISCYIENFGCLHAYRMHFHEGMNVLCEDNGFGKTTLAAFIKAMLYGLPVSKKADLNENERKKYTPWNPELGNFGGMIEFSVKGKIYRAERFFSLRGSAKEDRFVLYDMASNTVSNDYSERLGIELFGIDAGAYERSAFLPQKALSGGLDNASIVAKLNDIIDADDDIGSYELAASLLDKRRQFYRKHGGKGQIAELGQTMAEQMRQYAFCVDAAERVSRLTAEVKETERLILDAKKEKDAVRFEISGVQQKKVDAAVKSHGKELLQMQNAARLSLEEKQAFLKDAYASDAEWELAIAEMEECVRSTVRNEEKMGICLEEAARIEQAQEEIRSVFINGLPTEETIDALSDLEEVLTVMTEEVDIDPQKERDEQICASFEACYGTEIPDPSAIDEITAVQRAAQIAHMQMDAAKEDLVVDALPECLDEDVLSHHMEQVVRLSSLEKSLKQPELARQRCRKAFEDAGFATDQVLPDEASLDRYGDEMRTLAQVHQQTVQTEAQRAQAVELLRQLQEEYPQIPEESDLISVRVTYDNLKSKRTEIDAWEEKQRSAILAQAAAKKKMIWTLVLAGIFLAVCIIMTGLLVRYEDVRFLAVSATAGFIGLLLSVVSIVCYRLDIRKTEEGMPDDSALRRLCEKKSEYEAEKAEVNDFVEQYGGGSGEDGADADTLFGMLSLQCRRREELRDTIRGCTDLLAALSEENETLRRSLLALRENAYVTVDENIDESAFSSYRSRVRECTQARREADLEGEQRMQFSTQLTSVQQSLDAYLETLSALPYAVPSDVPSQDPYVLLTTWKRWADTARAKIEYVRACTEKYRETAEALLHMTEPFFIPDEGHAPEDTVRDWLLAVTACREARMRMNADQEKNAQRVQQYQRLIEQRDALLSRLFDVETIAESGIGICKRFFPEKDVLPLSAIAAQLSGKYRELSLEKMQYEERKEMLQKEHETLSEKTDAFSAQFFDAPYPSAEEVVRVVRETRNALAVNREQLKDAQALLRAFCEENAISTETLTEETITDFNTAVRLDVLQQEELRLDARIGELQQQRAMQWQYAAAASAESEGLTEAGEAVARTSAEIKEAEERLAIILKTKELLEDAKNALSVRYLGVMQECFRCYFAKAAGITEDEAYRYSLDSSLRPLVESGGIRREGDYLSRGNIDLINFCVRLALVDALYGTETGNGEMPVLVLDDPFVNLDERNLCAAKELLVSFSEHCQVLHLVCHESRIS